MSISIHNAIAEASQLLRRAGVEESRLEAGSLLASVLDCDRTFLIAHSDDAIPHDQLRIFRAFVERRQQREPLQYIVGHQEFFNLDFELTRDVLIPRPETEIIVEVALEVAGHDAKPFVADIGTGSGCLAITLLRQLPNARAIATDISNSALHIAQKNARRHHVLHRLSLITADGFSAFVDSPLFSLIVSNPPYISAGDFELLQSEVREWEPVNAFVAGDNGLAQIQKLLVDAPSRLRSGGYLIFEIGYDQRAAVQALINPDIWKCIEVRNDLQGIPRTVVLRNRIE